MPDVDSAQQPLYQGGVDIANDYAFESGVCVLPIAEDPPESEGELQTWSPVRVMRLHAPYRIRRQSYTARKQNNPPVVPEPADTGKFIFLGGAMGVSNVLNQGYANYDWVVSTEFSYVENCVSRPEDGLVLGAPPWDTDIEVVNRFNIQPATPTIGAISEAGAEAKVGFQMGVDTEAAEFDFGVYGYNNRSFFPGQFFSDELFNA